MKEFICHFIDRQITKLQKIIVQIMASETFKLLESFYHNQTWDSIRNGEIILGYKDMQYLTNKNSEESLITIEKLYQTENKQIHLVVSHAKFGHADLLFSIQEFLLSADKAYLTFSYHINSLSPLTETPFWDKLKIYGANLAVKFFPETINKQVFNNRELSEGVKATILENQITIDFHDAVRQSPLAQKRFLGYELLDFIQIVAINVHNRGLGIKLHFAIPEWLTSITLMLFSALIRKKVYKIPLFASAPPKSPFYRRLLPF